MERGWIKIHRKMTEWEWFSDQVTFSVFMNLLLTVNFEDKKWHGIDVLRGQRIIGLSRFAEEVGVSLQQLRTSLKRLESTGDISRKTTNRFTVICIEKFDTYQSRETAANIQTTNEQHSNNIQITNEQQQLKNERTKELKKEPKPLVTQSKFDDEDIRFAEWMFSKIESLPGNQKKPNFNKWANTIRLMRERDGLSLKAIGQVFNWANNDDFWSSNILSPEKLRAKFSQLSAKALRPEVVTEKNGPKTFNQQKRENNRQAMVDFVTGDDDDGYGQNPIRQIDG